MGESELSRARDWLISRTQVWVRKGRTWRPRAFHHLGQGGCMITIRQNTEWGLRVASRILLLCTIHASYAVPAERRPATRTGNLTTSLRGDRKPKADLPSRHFQNIHVQRGHAPVIDLKFTHLTTNDGLSQSYVTAILQDRRGFMWFATRGGLNRYDGNSFVVYKHNPSDPGSLSSNFIQDLIEDDHGYLWMATNTGVNKFDPTTERVTRYLHDANYPNSIGGVSVKSIARDSRGYLWFGTEDSGLDKFDPTTGAFTHYRKDSDGQFVGRITKVIADSQGNIWFVGERGLFHLNPLTAQITRAPATRNGLNAENVYQDEADNLWMLANSPIVGLVKYDRRAGRFTEYPLGARAVGVANTNVLADGQIGLWVPSSQGLYYFDRRKNVSRTGFSTRKTTRIASTATPSSRSIRIGRACCGWEPRMRALTFSISGKNSSSVICIAPPTPIVSHPEGSRQFIKIPMAFCGQASFHEPWTDSIERRAKSLITFPTRAMRIRSLKAVRLIAFTKMQRVISGWLARTAVLTGSMNAPGVSSITGTTLMIPTA